MAYLVSGASPRRRFVSRACSFALASGLAPRMAFAQTSYPSGPIRIIVPWAPGGLVDVGGRVVAEALQSGWGKAVAVENVPGAAGTLGADKVAKAAADGHTLLMGTSSIAIDVGAGRKLPFDPLADLTPIAVVADTHSVVVVPPNSPIGSIGELIATTKADPGSLTYGTPGIGSPAHLFVELFSQLAGVQMLHVPYGRTQAINDLLGGRLAVMFSTVPSAMLHIRNKLVRPLAVTAASRLASLPDVPTIIEAGVPGYEASQWLGVFVSAGTPPDAVRRLNAEITRAVKTPAVAQTLSARGMDPRTATPEEFADILAVDVRKWGQVIRKGNIKLE